jgi:hypothetical protein
MAGNFLWELLRVGKMCWLQSEINQKYACHKKAGDSTDSALCKHSLYFSICEEYIMSMFKSVAPFSTVTAMCLDNIVTMTLKYIIVATTLDKTVAFLILLVALVMSCT